MRALLLLVPLAACPQTSGDDDSGTVSDDDSVVTDDDTADDDSTDDDSVDDDTTADDDTADDDDADDDTTPDPTPAPSTFVEILEPTAAPVAPLQSFVLQTDGDFPGLSRWTLDGDEVDTVFVNPNTHQTDFEVDTAQWPDGAYLLEVELLSWGLTDSVTMTIAHGDLLSYDLGSVVFAADPQFGPTLDALITPPAVSMTVQVAIDDSLSPQWIGSFVQDPAGDFVVTDTWAIPGAGASPYAGCIPNHPNAPFDAGDYTLWPAADPTLAGQVGDVEVLVKRSFGEPEAGLLHLDLYFTPGTGLQTDAANDPRVIALLDQVEAIYLQADIAIGDVRYWNILDPGFDTVTSYTELWDLFGAGADNEDRTLPVFFIGEFDLSTELLGIAAHIPGPALANGSRQAGIAVDVSQLLNNDIGSAAAVMAHEIAHYLGLFHPTEIGAVAEDPLLDTATCCDTGGCWQTNLMDPYAYGNTTITDDQRFVLLRHPLVELIPASALPPARNWLPETSYVPLEVRRID